jgi:hypothetical protein
MYVHKRRVNYLDETLKKVVLHSVATALASMVLPVPENVDSTFDK